MKIDKGFLNIRNLSDVMNKSEGSIRMDIYRGHIPEKIPPFIRLGRSIVWDPETVEEWLRTKQAEMIIPKKKPGRPKKVPGKNQSSVVCETEVGNV